MQEQHEWLDALLHLMRLMRRGSGQNRDLPRSVYHLLRVVMDEGSIRTSELAQRLDIRPSSLTELLHRAQAHELITRERDPDDSRAYRIRATPGGAALMERHHDAHVARAQSLRLALTPEEAAQFTQLCQKLCDHLAATQGKDTAPAQRRKH